MGSLITSKSVMPLIISRSEKKNCQLFRIIYILNKTILGHQIKQSLKYIKYV